MLDRITGFDLETAKFIVRELANLHATSLALKLTQPNIFSQKIKPFLHNFVLPDDEFHKMINTWRKSLENNPETKQLAPRMQRVLERRPEFLPREPFATLSHSDLWLNNIMVKITNGNTENVKFLDFQFLNYKSPAADLLFMLLTSLSNKNIEENFDYLLEYFYKSFSEMLLKLNCEVPKLSMETFLEEVRTEATTAEIFHVAFMTLVVFASGNAVKDVTEYEENAGILGEISLLVKERIWFLTEEFAKRNWI